MGTEGIDYWVVWTFGPGGSEFRCGSYSNKDDAIAVAGKLLGTYRKVRVVDRKGVVVWEETLERVAE